MSHNTKTAVMQPYFMPYIGYFQLICAVDTFVVLDDVNFIMKGWINRNNILLNGEKHLFTIPLEKSSQNKLILDTKLNFSDKDKGILLKTLQTAYKRAPLFPYVYPLLEEIIMQEENRSDSLHHAQPESCSCLLEHKKNNTQIIGNRKRHVFKRTK